MRRPLLVLMALVTASSVRAETLIERGAYLVNAVAACSNCHTPRNPKGPSLSGGNRFGDGDNAVFAPNITPDSATGLGAWTDDQIIAAIRYDVRPNGTHIRPPMPQHAFAAISQADMLAIIAYLRSVPAIQHSVAVTPGAASMPAPRPTPRPVSDDTPISKGRYLVTGPAHCVECHSITPGGNNPPRVYKGSWGTSSAPSLAPDRMKAYSDAEVARLITTGVRPDGGKLVGPMPIAAYSGLRPDDITSIIAFLRRADAS